MNPQPWHLRLIEARTAAKLNQADLGRLLGVDRRTVHKMEQGQRALDVELCERLAVALKCDKVWLAGWAKGN